MNLSPVRAAAVLLLSFAATALADAGFPAQGDRQSRPARTQAARPAARPPEIEGFVAELNVAPPDVAADILLRLAGSDKVAERAWKKELVERAFVLAGEARAPVRRKTAPYVTHSVDTSAGYLTYAYDLRLDSLSLRARAVRSMLALDPPRALELFGQITLKLEPLKCGDALAYDVSDFYALLAEVARASFAGEEARLGVRSRFMLPYVEAVSSPAQVGLAAKAILSAQLSGDEVATLSSALAHSLSGVAADDRSFTAAVQAGGATADVKALVQELGERKDNHAGDLAAAYRKFFLAGLTAERCAEDVPPSGKPPYYLAEANEQFFKESPLKTDDLRPAGVGGRAGFISEYWQTPDSKKLLHDYRELRFAPDAAEHVKDGRLPTRADAGTPEWDALLRRLLAELEGWGGAGEASPLDYFNQQQVLYGGLLEITPPGQARAEVLASWLKSLEGLRDGDAEVQRRLFVSYFVKAVSASPPETRDDFMTRMIYSGDALISAWAKAARLKL